MLIMVRDYRNGKYIYHLTSMGNMRSIFMKGLLPRNALGKNDMIDIANPDIIDYREKNNLTEYVPFHFFAGTPFAYIVQINHPQDSFVYIAIKRTEAEKLAFEIIPQHPMSGDMKFSPQRYTYLEGINKIDWNLMNQKDYRSNACKMVCLAECISPNPVQITELVQNTFSIAFFVKNSDDETALQQIYTTIDPSPKKSLYIIVDAKKFAL